MTIPVTRPTTRYLFITHKGEQISHKMAFRILGRIVKESGISGSIRLGSINKINDPPDKRESFKEKI